MLGARERYNQLITQMLLRRAIGNDEPSDED
jgi:hypothetical protein